MVDAGRPDGRDLLALRTGAPRQTLVAGSPRTVPPPTPVGSRSGGQEAGGRHPAMDPPILERWSWDRMTRIAELISLVRPDDEGQGLAEYALILALIAIVAIVALIFLGGQISSILSEVGKSM